MSPNGTQNNSEGGAKARAAKDDRVSVRVRPDVKAALEEAARRDKRNVSSYVEALLETHLEGLGLLKGS